MEMGPNGYMAIQQIFNVYVSTLHSVELDVMLTKKIWICIK